MDYRKTYICLLQHIIQYFIDRNANTANTAKSLKVLVNVIISLNRVERKRDTFVCSPLVDVNKFNYKAIFNHILLRLVIIILYLVASDKSINLTVNINNKHSSIKCLFCVSLVFLCVFFLHSTISQSHHRCLFYRFIIHFLNYECYYYLFLLFLFNYEKLILFELYFAFHWTSDRSIMPFLTLFYFISFLFKQIKGDMI